MLRKVEYTAVGPRDEPHAMHGAATWAMRASPPATLRRGAAAACYSLQPPASPCWFWTLRAATSRSERATRSCGERGGMLDSERPLAALRYCWWCCWPAGTGSWGRWWGGKSNSPRASAFLLIQSTPYGPAGVALGRRRQPCPLNRPPPPRPPTPCRSNRRRQPSRPSRRAVA